MPICGPLTSYVIIRKTSLCKQLECTPRCAVSNVVMYICILVEKSTFFVFWTPLQTEISYGLQIVHVVLKAPTHVLPPFQNIGRFGFSRFIVFTMHLDITYV